MGAAHRTAPLTQPPARGANQPSFCSADLGKGARGGCTPDPGLSLIALLGPVPDRRYRRGVRHLLPGLLAVEVVAVLVGACLFAEIG